MISIDLHGYTAAEAGLRLEQSLRNALDHGEQVVRIIHGQGKHSQNFPVIKSQVRHWLEESEFAREFVQSVFRGEDGSPYTPPNAGETVILLKLPPSPRTGATPLAEDPEEEREARRNAKALRADRLRTVRRRGPRR